MIERMNADDFTEVLLRSFETSFAHLSIMRGLGDRSPKQRYEATQAYAEASGVLAAAEYRHELLNQKLDEQTMERLGFVIKDGHWFNGLLEVNHATGASMYAGQIIRSIRNRGDLEDACRLLMLPEKTEMATLNRIREQQASYTAQDMKKPPRETPESERFLRIAQAEQLEPGKS